MKRLLQVALLGNPVLRSHAKIVKNIKNRMVQELIDDMLETVMDVDGVGIAAPQVYQSLQVFIMASRPNPRYPNAPKMKSTVVINPRVIKFSREKEKGWEGCLSLPGLRGFVPRSTAVKVEYDNRQGKHESCEFQGFLARIFLHEFDHLQGKLFIDRVESTLDLMSEKEWQKKINKK